jgi:ATP-dependent Clp protease ATP-binding subunit ClpA
MFERFSKEARTSVAQVQAEARQLGSTEITPGHMLLGLASAGGPWAAVLTEHGVDAPTIRRRLLATRGHHPLDPDALATLGIDLEQVRFAAEAHLGPGALDATPGKRRLGHLPFTKPAKKVLELSLREALQLGADEIGAEFLLLGLLREGSANWLLSESGVRPEQLRDEVISRIQGRAA